jgi:glycosyltransferase involved in cell wall biosynthesis/predicted O-methyltransferase YrrM
MNLKLGGAMARAQPALPDKDYVSPGLAVIMPDAAFPNMVVGDTRVPRWPWLRRWVEQNWYTDRRNPDAGFASRDEAAILYNSALLVRGKPCLEVGCWRGWSTVHLALGAGAVHTVDPILGDRDFAESLRASCKGAGVIDRVSVHEGSSPGAIDTLSQSTGTRWSLIFIDADHEGDAPCRDAEAALRNAADTALVLFHDLASPFVAAGLDVMRNAGWRTMVYQTMQIMGVAWRGEIEPIAHIPDPRMFWTLPAHLAGYEVSGWKRPTLPRTDGGWWPNMTLEDRVRAAAFRAQAAEDDRTAILLDHRAAMARAQAEMDHLRAMVATERAGAGRAEARLVPLAERLGAAALECDQLLRRAQAAESRLEDLAASQRQQEIAHQALDTQRRQRLARALGQSHEQENGAIFGLARWAARKRVLIGLLRRSAPERNAILDRQIVVLGVRAPIGAPFVASLAHRAGVVRLLRRSTSSAEAIVASQLLRAAMTCRDRALTGALTEALMPALNPSNAGAPPLPTRAEAEAFGEMAALDEAVARVHATALFDSDDYRARAGLDQRRIDPALHYVLLGEALGIGPCPTFDPSYYAARYPDVLHAGLGLFLHYAEHGRAEGRSGTMPVLSHANARQGAPDRENVIVVVHESSRSGAPILGWNIARHLAARYNVFTVLLGDGPLTQDFQAVSAETYGPFPPSQREGVDIAYGLRSLFANRRFRYAIVNSSESRRAVEVCARHGVPTLFLLHEFGTYVQPVAELRSAFDWATEIVFPAAIVARSSETVHPALKDRPIHILPQGMSVVPPGKSLPKPMPLATLGGLAQARESGTFLVLGAGSVEFRKGVDLFLATASTTVSGSRRGGLARPLQFVWVGHGYEPTEDMEYSLYLHEQIQRSGLEDHVTFLSEVADLEPIYALADAFLLSSRLDPLANVSIDAACRGIPVICFRDSSGMADLMLADPLTAAGVVPHLDAEAAGREITRLASDPAARRAMSKATMRLAHEIFDMERYVGQLDALGRAHGPGAGR